MISNKSYRYKTADDIGPLLQIPPQAFPSVVLTDSEPGSNSSVLLAEGGPRSFSSSSLTSREAPFSAMVDPASASRVANKVAQCFI